MDEFKELSSSGTFEFVHFSNIAITDHINEATSMESILQCLPNVKQFYIDEIIPSFSSPEAASNIIVAKMESFEIYLIRESFNFQTFTEFMKVHPSIHCRMSYNIQFDLSPKYLQQLQQYIDKVIADNSIQYPPPLIYFNGQKSPGALDRLYACCIGQHGEQ
uniref:Uncharacterized protein n=2 Tax=Panagrolaimus sp. PS1159 TaxID=55785 RepID=A0AC35GGE9_9BILA